MVVTPSPLTGTSHLCPVSWCCVSSPALGHLNVSVPTWSLLCSMLLSLLIYKSITMVVYV